MENLIPSTPLPTWLPRPVRRRLAGKKYQLKRLPESVRRRMRTPEKIKVSEHAAKYRIATEAPHDGPWRHELAPHGVKVMDTYGLPHVREMWFSAPEQAVKTNAMLNCLHWGVDVDPGDVYYVMPSEKAMEKITSGKIIPMLRASKRLKKFIGKKEADTTLSKIKLSNGVTIRPAHAGSASSTASFPAKHCFIDEADKCPERVGREADIVTLVKKRLRQYKGRGKLFVVSTPAGMFVCAGVKKCNQIWEYRHKCPECEQLFKPEYDQLVIPEGLTDEDEKNGLSIPEKLDAADITVDTEIYYPCTECGTLLSERDRLDILKTPHWVCIKGAELLRPSKVGFHMRGFDCPDVPLHENAAAYVAAKKGGITEKIALANGYEAIDYEYEQQDRKEDFILRLRDEHLPRNIVPANTYGLIIQADTQQRGFFYQVWAVGWGTELPITVIDHGFVLTFENLKDKQVKEFQTADGTPYRPSAGFIDSGGGTNPDRPKHSRTVEVYNFCRKNKFWRPLKGRRTMEMPWNVKRLDFYPSSVGKKVPIPGGLLLYTINTTLYKDDLDIKLNIEPGSPGAISFHGGVDANFAKQLCAEYRDERGYWHCRKGVDNHQGDNMVYGLALADIIGIKDKKKGGKKVHKKRSKGGGFVNNY